MNRYTIENGGKRYVVEAASEQEALELVASQSGGSQSEQPAQEAPKPKRNINQWALAKTGQRVEQGAINFAPDVGRLALRAGGPAVGQAVGVATGPLSPVAVPALGAVGGALGEFGAQVTEGDIRPGAILAAAGIGAIPGSPVASGGRAMARGMAVDAAANVGAANLESLVDRGEMAGIGQNILAAAGGAIARPAELAMTKPNIKAVQKTVQQQTLADAMAAGYVIPPSVARKTNPSRVNDIIEDVAGKAATLQEAAIRNQEITNNLLLKELGLPADAPITQALLDARRAELGQAYEVAGSLSPRAANALERWKKHSSEARGRRMSANRTGDYDQAKLAEKAEGLRDAYEGVLLKEAKKAGVPEVYQNLIAAKQGIAKVYDVDNALNLGDGNIAAGVIGRAYNSGKRLTGNLELVARMQQAFPQVMRPSSSVPAPGVSRGDFYFSALAGGAGAHFGGPVGGAVGAASALLAPAAARRTVLSGPYQQMMLGDTPQADISALLARYMAMSAGRTEGVQN